MELKSFFNNLNVNFAQISSLGCHVKRFKSLSDVDSADYFCVVNENSGVIGGYCSNSLKGDKKSRLLLTSYRIDGNIVAFNGLVEFKCAENHTMFELKHTYKVEASYNCVFAKEIGSSPDLLRKINVPAFVSNGATTLQMVIDDMKARCPHIIVGMTQTHANSKSVMFDDFEEQYVDPYRIKGWWLMGKLDVESTNVILENLSKELSIIIEECRGDDL
ncbi:hypothetical protein Cyrtocomes_00833 [Candidatus Cyrtobacter comes]|uniref:Uncharacterized protein n=1 Tax=Candidatus Cyrtobacter comes TaxID=675776 RepID=A0ABU5L8L0_9RICK|nr:hypothetical protein [Candidatus Cyrtobacter comes]MDZ5762450.1 hypothetical protein [Candidatus Cyrtobacter comes]